MRGGIGGVLLAATLGTSAQAQDARRLKVAFDIGFVNAAGNTSVTTLNAAENLEFRPGGGRWQLKEAANVVYGRNADSTTAEQLKVTARVDYGVRGPMHVFVAATFERNRFAGIRHRFEEILGIALQPVDTPRDLLAIEIGSAVTQQRSTAQVSTRFVAARMAARYKHQFTDAVYLQQALETLPNIELTDDWRVNSETTVVAPVSSRVAIKLSYVLRYDNLPEPGFRRTDRVFSSALQVVF